VIDASLHLHGSLFFTNLAGQRQFHARGVKGIKTCT
jgi:hypothetical protein